MSKYDDNEIMMDVLDTIARGMAKAIIYAVFFAAGFFSCKYLYTNPSFLELICR